MTPYYNVNKTQWNYRRKSIKKGLVMKGYVTGTNVTSLVTAEKDKQSSKIGNFETKQA